MDGGEDGVREDILDWIACERVAGLGIQGGRPFNSNEGIARQAFVSFTQRL